MNEERNIKEIFPLIILFTKLFLLLLKLKNIFDLLLAFRNRLRIKGIIHVCDSFFNSDNSLFVFSIFCLTICKRDT